MNWVDDYILIPLPQRFNAEFNIHMAEFHGWWVRDPLLKVPWGLQDIRNGKWKRWGFLALAIEEVEEQPGFRILYGRGRIAI